MKVAVWLCRLILGSTFMLSGLTKIIDPTGTLIKIEAYLAAWQWDVPRGITLVGGSMLAMVEFVSGFLVATGSLRRVSVWTITAIMAFMLPLTAYIATANPVDDCGCFGDFFTLSNTHTFIKNIVLSALAIFLLFFNRRCPSLFAPWSQWIQILFAAVYLAVIAVIGYFVQPLLDFRPYPVGEPLVPTRGAAILFKYKAPNGEVRTFDEDHLPDESKGWEFIDIETTGGAVDKLFAAFDRTTGEDVTDRVLNAPELMMFLFPEPSAATAAASYTANELKAKMTERYGPESFIGITAADTDAVETALDLMMADYPVYYADPKVITTLARGDMAVVYLRRGRVMWKRTLSSINLDRFTSDADPARAYDTRGRDMFDALSSLFLSAEASLWLISALFARRKRRVASAAV